MTLAVDPGGALAAVNTKAHTLRVPAVEVAVACIVLVNLWFAVLIGVALLLYAFPKWLYLARRNLELLPEVRPRWAPGWAVGAWFVPVANLLLGPLVVRDVIRESVFSRPRLVWAMFLMALAMFSAAVVTAAVLPGDGVSRALTAAGGLALIVVVGWVSRQQQQQLDAAR